jgi:hypothetical protein
MRVVVKNLDNEQLILSDLTTIRYRAEPMVHFAIRSTIYLVNRIYVRFRIKEHLGTFQLTI